ncbi:hypothetical protein K469DRAFT_753470 [Zopfia rhizophila CBS 207.26]|uniref:DUF1640-domain-containing protein n=1 Tax=Zopfia rhizophila CBS 207.26 TaxID=1314779 RepID=A0A6A6DL44_9PEZI|nr:hypothetical protein K469DRAFT_753470 [Zopfia rhizophila CBS 207.26]
MSAPRLPFLWPVLYRPLKPPQRKRGIACAARNVRFPKSFTTSTHQAQGTGTYRYGAAQEPAAHLLESKQVHEEKEKQATPPTNNHSPEPAEDEEEDITSSPTSRPRTLDASESVPKSPVPDPPRVPESKPLDTVLHMPSPAEEENKKAPHLKTPPYVHHFDTYGLVKDLAKSGFTQEQAVTIMKALRAILTDNMELARAGLVSKSNVENETYLFRAACSELRTEISNNRKGETEKMRTERNQLQHEVDILNQRLAQESSSLKDELKGLFDDRKMAVRQEQRTMETKLQELNYKITVALNSDARSEVEGLRWELTRRAAIAIGVSALMLFAALRYSSHVNHTQSEEKKKAQENKPPPQEGQNGPSAGNADGLSKDEALGDELLATKGGVSLG